MDLTTVSSDVRSNLKLALQHLRSALQILDEADAPGQIGAHLDLAVHQLDDFLSNVVSTAHVSRPGGCEAVTGNCA